MFPTKTSEEFTKWTYQQLLEQLQKRYTDFKVNNKFNGIRKPLLGDAKFVKARYLDPDNPRSGKKDFYSPTVIGEFDKHERLPSDLSFGTQWSCDHGHRRPEVTPVSALTRLRFGHSGDPVNRQTSAICCAENLPGKLRTFPRSWAESNSGGPVPVTGVFGTQAQREGQ